jgi:hypothetical protein
MRSILCVLFAVGLEWAMASDGAAPDFRNYPRSQWFTSHVYQQTNAFEHLPAEDLVWLTEFPCGDGSAFQAYVDWNGREHMGFYTEFAMYGGHDRYLSTNEVQALRSALHRLPLTNASPPIENLGVVSFREGTNWITRTFEADYLSVPMSEVYRIMEFRWQRRTRVK